jgi:hypothetical protein
MRVRTAWRCEKSAGNGDTIVSRLSVCSGQRVSAALWCQGYEVSGAVEGFEHQVLAERFKRAPVRMAWC